MLRLLRKLAGLFAALVLTLNAYAQDPTKNISPSACRTQAGQNLESLTIEQCMSL